MSDWEWTDVGPASADERGYAVTRASGASRIWSNGRRSRGSFCVWSRSAYASSRWSRAIRRSTASPRRSKVCATSRSGTSNDALLGSGGVTTLAALLRLRTLPAGGLAFDDRVVESAFRSREDAPGCLIPCRAGGAGMRRGRSPGSAGLGDITALAGALGYGMMMSYAS